MIRLCTRSPDSLLYILYIINEDGRIVLILKKVLILSCLSTIFNLMDKYAGQQQLTNAQLDRTFSVLPDPARRAILARLTKGETLVSDIAAPFGMSLTAISRHTKLLIAHTNTELNTRLNISPSCNIFVDRRAIISTKVAQIVTYPD